MAAVAAHHPRPAPLPGLAGMETAPPMGGPALPLPATHAEPLFTTVVLRELIHLRPIRARGSSEVMTELQINIDSFGCYRQSGKHTPGITVKRLAILPNYCRVTGRNHGLF